jgi:hypothetical protein
MIGVDDLLDDAHWVNVQDPIKQMFLALSKAIRVQAASIRDLDRKCSDHLSSDQVHRIVRDSFENSCSKQDAAQLIYQLETKVSERQYSITEAKLEAVSRSITSIFFYCEQSISLRK